MKKTGLFVLMILFLTATPNAKADSPDIATIIKKSTDAINATRLGSRKLVFVLKEGDQGTGEWSARVVHKGFEDGEHSLLVIMEPEVLKGNAYLFWQPVDKPQEEWVYFPPTRRVRKLPTFMAYDSFLGTDFTWADLGIKDPEGTSKLISEETHSGKKAYKIETIPEQQWYYSRIVSWIATDTFLPIQRDYFDPQGGLWKTKLFENVVVLKTISMPLKIRMVDHMKNSSTEIIVSDVCFDVDYIPSDAFDPKKLSEAALSPVCSMPMSKKE